MKIKLIQLIACFLLVAATSFSQAVSKNPSKSNSTTEIATVEKCFANPQKHYISTPDFKSDEDVYSLFRKASKEMKKDEKLFIYTYSQGSFGTTGLQLMTGAVKSHADYILKSKKRFEVIEGGYRDEASIDIFVLGEKCAKLAESEYKGDASLEVFTVDFADAPLGLSVFPNRKELKELTLKTVEGECGYRCDGITFYIIVGTDGRVVLAHPAETFIRDDIQARHLNYAISNSKTKEIRTEARGLLDQWVFQTPVIDGIPRFIRGTVFVPL